MTNQTKRAAQMDSMALMAARELLLEVTPLKADCGRLCGAACCASAAGQDSGMLLYPDEAALYDPAPAWARVQPIDLAIDWVIDSKPTPLLVCDGTCPRADRPLACRVFPLTARARGAGFAVELDPRAWAVCPLMPHGLAGLDPAFVAAARAAFALLWERPAYRAYLCAQDVVLSVLTRGF
jgi:hypothetical protein